MGKPGEATVDWGTEAAATVKTMSEAHMKVWQTWFDFFQTSPASPKSSLNLNGQWGDFARQGTEAWTAQSEEIVKEVSSRLLKGQDTLMKLLELSTQTWKAIAPKVESGEDWETVLRQSMDGLRQQINPSAEWMSETSNDLTEVWQLYLKEFQKLTQPLAKSMGRGPWYAGQAATGDGSSMVELVNLLWDAYEPAFGPMLDTPSLGQSRELREKQMKGFQAWIESRRASFEYQVLLADAWVQALEQVMRKMVSLLEKKEPVQDLRQTLSLWIEVIDAVLLEVFRSDKYIQIQGRLVNTGMAYKICERDLMETFLKSSHLPSRGELDEAYRRIYELRKEVKELKKAVTGSSIPGQIINESGPQSVNLNKTAATKKKKPTRRTKSQ